ncbi:MAG TPA: hypothetical protein VEI58_02840, partial [Chthoniobacterales bacterium]|nr:hypothetical protein [Chthoniobacterales bacterium]
NVTVQNNSLLLPGPSYNNWWPPFQTTSSTYLENNQLDPAIVNGSGVVPVCWKYDNRYSTGTIVPFLLDNFTP